jgi:hypothetical protein
MEDTFVRDTVNRLLMRNNRKLPDSNRMKGVRLDVLIVIIVRITVSGM